MSINVNNTNSGSGSINMNSAITGNINNINSQNQNSQNLTQIAQDIRVLIAQYSQSSDPSTASGKMMITSKVMETIETNPTLKHRVISSLKEAGSAALESAIDHPIAKVLIAGVKGFID